VKTKVQFAHFEFAGRGIGVLDFKRILDSLWIQEPYDLLLYPSDLLVRQFSEMDGDLPHHGNPLKLSSTEALNSPYQPFV
jgi:hypothetical protein